MNNQTDLRLIINTKKMTYTYAYFQKLKPSNMYAIQAKRNILPIEVWALLSCTYDS